MRASPKRQYGPLPNSLPTWGEGNDDKTPPYGGVLLYLLKVYKERRGSCPFNSYAQRREERDMNIASVPLPVDRVVVFVIMVLVLTLRLMLG